MKKYSEKLDKLVDEALTTLQELIIKHGISSEHMNCECLRITEEKYNFNLDGGRYLSELHYSRMLDDGGYAYNYSVLPTSDLLELVDYLVELYNHE